MNFNKLIKKTMFKCPPALWSIRHLFHSYPLVFMYHRFSGVDDNNPNLCSIDGRLFGQHLDEILKYYQIETLEYCLEYYSEKGFWPKKTAVITVDDGHRDFYYYAYPELKKRNIKATFFVTVKFVEKSIWLWPDKVNYTIYNSNICNISFQEIDNGRSFDLTDSYMKNDFLLKFTEFCKKISDENKCKAIAELEEKLELHVPDSPTIEYDSVSWCELKELSEYGIEIGSHTMTHPILSRISKEKLSYEITESKNILEDKLSVPIKSFCYPNSLPQDISDDVVEITKASGYLGAVHDFGIRVSDPFLIPRSGASKDFFDFMCKVNRLEHLGMAIRFFWGKGIL